MFHIEKMKVGDFSFAVQLANTMNWSMTSKDFEFMMKLEPDGCFVLFNGKERLGIATCISFGEVGWFGNLVVKEKFRREGAGYLLTEHSIEYLKVKGAETIGLYAYPHLVKFYERFGFRANIDFAVLKGRTAVSAPQDSLKLAKKRDINDIIDFDLDCFGVNRTKLLEAILLNPANLCYLSTENNKIIGYVTAKIYANMAEVGPLVCQVNLEEKAVLLLETILSKLNCFEGSIYVPRKELKLLKLMYDVGLKEDFHVLRMFLGPSVGRDCIYIAESLERG